LRISSPPSPTPACRAKRIWCSTCASCATPITTPICARATAAILVVAALGAIHVAAARREDALLGARHGAAFEEYRRTVRAFLPRWSAYAVPERLEVRPRVLWKSFLDAGSLLGYYALLVLADALQLAGVTPTWLVLP
jgi:hypothetical protein